MTTVFRYVAHDLVETYKARGWVIADTFNGIHHGRYSVLMKWEGAGEPVE